MNVTYVCYECGRTSCAAFDAGSTRLRCARCGHETGVPPGAVVDDQLQRCLVCPSRELYGRKDFPQRLGLTIVVLGFVASCIPWYYQRWYATFAILFATALIDLILYTVTGSLLQCYQCRAQYRGTGGIDEHAPFDLAVHERHRQQRARLEAGRVEPHDR